MTGNDAFLREVNCLVGSLEVLSSPLPVYDKDVCVFLNELSQSLLKNPAVRNYPDVVSFAYWCRKGNIAKHKTASAQSAFSLNARTGYGLALHIAPSNIPVNFAFSFVFALLAGNANIVRVPSKPFPQTTIICETIKGLLDRFPELKKRTAFISYPASDKITGELSKQADIRIIWGGDATVSKITNLPHKPRCKDVLFTDRYSIALIDANAIMNASDKELEALAVSFYNDTYLMDQNACSSPQMIFWLNSSDDAKDRFWTKIRNCAQTRYALQGAVVVDKYLQVCENIIDGVARPDLPFDGLAMRMDVEILSEESSGLRGVGGLFYQYSITNVEDIAPIVSERCQTLVYYGFEAEELREFVVSMHLKGIDRIVPIGMAMDIDLVWDGRDLLCDLSRIVDAR